MQKWNAKHETMKYKHVKINTSIVHTYASRRTLRQIHIFGLPSRTRLVHFDTATMLYFVISEAEKSLKIILSKICKNSQNLRIGKIK